MATITRRKPRPGPAAGPDPAPRRDAEAAPAFTLQVMTYNIHKGFSTGNARFVLHQMRDALERADVDLIFLQEIQGAHAYRQWLIDDWPNAPQSDFLADRRWPHRAYGKNAIYDAGHHGNAILSKYPIRFWENINVSGNPIASRSVLHAEIALPQVEQPIHVICIHFGLSGAERRRQLSVLTRRIRSHVPHQAPLIIAGDFNDWTRQAEHQMRTHLGLMDVFVTLNNRPAKTFPVWYPVLAVDRIFYRGAIPITCQCLNDMPWRQLSDHAALYAAFSLAAEPARRERQPASGLTLAGSSDFL
ncbi:MAG: endonuclease/exonuclease/phosphatase family protein [Gammaproteobacteria bacterium]